MKHFLILPHQLFDKKYLDKSYKFILYEHPHYFKKYKYNKKKLLLHRASMKYYFDYLKQNKFNVHYIEFNAKLPTHSYILFDPIDKIDIAKGHELVESPNFLLTKDIYKKYREKTDKFFFSAFYMWSKKELNIIPKIKSQDKFNRKKLPKDIKVPKIIKFKEDQKYISEAKKYIEKNFKNNYGNVDEFIYPVTHKSAKRLLNDFIKNKLSNFGSYQDAIKQEDQYLFHSLLSSSINIGLINPSEIVPKIIKSKEKINNVEGFIRQLFWREYQRYCYIYFNFNNKNYFGNNKKLSKKWYDGTTKIKPVDDAIKNAFNSGYLHHIQRLMVIGNFMNLSQIKPKEGFRWFMEFSCDSYEWVMHQNVYEMVFFISGGGTMTRPYVSSSNYILKMSDYKKEEWCDVWDKLYHDFIKRNKKKLYKFRYFFRI